VDDKQLVEAESIEEVVRMAQEFPWVRYGCIEVRPVRDVQVVRKRAARRHCDGIEGPASTRPRAQSTSASLHRRPFPSHVPVPSAASMTSFEQTTIGAQWRVRIDWRS
jgi:hypothetical protein